MSEKKTLTKADIKKYYVKTFQHFKKGIKDFHIHAQDLFDSKGQLVPQEVLNFEINITRGFRKFLIEFSEKTISKMDKGKPDSDEDIKHRFRKIVELRENTILRLYSIFDVYYKDNNKTRLKQQLVKLYDNFFIYLKWISEKKAKDRNSYSPSNYSDSSSASDSDSEAQTIDIDSPKGLDNLFSSKKSKSKRTKIKRKSNKKIKSNKKKSASKGNKSKKKL